MINKAALHLKSVSYYVLARIRLNARVSRLNASYYEQEVDNIAPLSVARCNICLVGSSLVYAEESE